MNDEEIKKSLERCSSDRLSKCVGCGISKNGCQEYLASQALNLINRLELENKEDSIAKLQDSLLRANKYGIEADCENTRLKAEIERLKTDLKTTENVIKNSFLEKAGFDIDLLAEFKSEAIKECVNKYTEMLIDEYHLRTDLQIASIKRLEQKVLIEMVGGENA